MKKNISQSIEKIDHYNKISGEALYVADYSIKNIYHGKIIRSIHPKAKILKVKLPNLPSEYTYINYKDIPGKNEVHIVEDDIPVFAEKKIEYIGDAIGMLVGPNLICLNKLFKQIEVEYKIVKPILSIEESNVIFFNYKHNKGNVEKSFKEADEIYEETFETGYQEHAYLETQGMIAETLKNKIIIHGSMQCPYYIHNAIKKVLNLKNNEIEIRYNTTGGGFGGKEGYPSILACQVAVASYKIKKPVRIIYDRKEDMEFTSKRHPGKFIYSAAIKNKMVTAMKIDLKYNSGAYTTLSPVVLQRGTICSNGVYNIPNLQANGRAVKTNTVPNGAFRGFGGPQVFFSCEIFMKHIADKLKIDPFEFKQKHFVKLNDITSTQGKYHFPVPLNKMTKEIIKKSNYIEKYNSYKKNFHNRYRKGIGISMFFHGAGFTGNGERDIIKAVIKLHKYKNNKVEILTSNTDMGQGLKTTLSKIVSNELNIPINQIIVKDPSTDFVPDSGPTAASRSLMIIGEMVRRASIKLRKNWIDNKEQIIEEHYKHPSFLIPFDNKNFIGDAYPTYSWGVNVIEIEVDTFIGIPKVINAYGLFDVGTPIDETIVLGQMEGGFAQSIGHSSMESIPYNKHGRIMNKSYSDYIIPTSMDIPELNCSLYIEKYPEGPYGAKGAGELPTVGGTGAYIAALEQALNIKINHIPFTPEDILNSLKNKKEK